VVALTPGALSELSAPLSSPGRKRFLGLCLVCLGVSVVVECPRRSRIRTYKAGGDAAVRCVYAVPLNAYANPEPYLVGVGLLRRTARPDTGKRGIDTESPRADDFT